MELTESSRVVPSSPDEYPVRGRIVRNALWNLFQSGSGLLLGVITSAVVARGLGPSDMGYLSYVNWLVGSLVTLACLGAPGTITKYVSEWIGQANPQDARALASDALRSGLAISGVLAATGALAAWIWAAPELRLALFLGLAGLPIRALLNLIIAVVAGWQDYGIISRLNLLSLVLQLGFSILALVLGWGVPGIVAAGILSNLVYLALMMASSRRMLDANLLTRLAAGARGPSRLLQQPVRGYLLGMAMMSLIDLVVWQKSEIFFLKHWRTPEEVAFYSLGFTISGLAMMAPRAFAGVLMPAISDMYGEGASVSIQRLYVVSTRYLGLMALPVALLSGALIDRVVPLIYGQSYAPAASIVMIVIISSSMGAIAGAGSAVLYGTDGIRFMVRAGILIALLNIALDLALIPGCGAIGAALASTASQGVGVLVGTSYVLYYNQIAAWAILKPLAKALACATLSALLARVIILKVPGMAGLVLAAGLGGVSYCIFAWLTGALQRADVTLLWNAIIERKAMRQHGDPSQESLV